MLIFALLAASFWIFNLTSQDNLATLSPCQEWILENSTDAFKIDECKADICPPSELFAFASGWPCLGPDEDDKFNER